MALNIKICSKVAVLCNEIVIEDITGAYSAENTGGYGAPNPTIATITAYDIKVELADETFYTVDALSALPDNKLHIPFSSIGGDLAKATQVLKITATVTTNDGGVVVAETYIDMFVYCEQTEIVKGLFLQLAQPGCCANCTDEKTRRVMFVFNTYQALEFAASSNNMTKSQALIDIINSYKDTDICKC